MTEPADLCPWNAESTRVAKSGMLGKVFAREHASVAEAEYESGLDNANLVEWEMLA